MRSNIHKIDVNAEFKSGKFMGFFQVTKDIQTKENLTFEDFTALEIYIGSAIDNFLDMKHREKEFIK